MRGRGRKEEELWRKRECKSDARWRLRRETKVEKVEQGRDGSEKTDKERGLERARNSRELWNGENKRKTVRERESECKRF